MTQADKLTTVRLVFAPLFFVLYTLQEWFPLTEQWNIWLVPLLWVLFIVAELTDLFDGMVARARGEVSDFGKLYDPFADTLARMTYFLCFVVDGILPALLFIVILYREFGILFLRLQVMKKGVAMGARSGGKIKAVCYMLAGGFALLYSSIVRFDPNSPLAAWAEWAAVAVFAVSVVLALVSFVDYYRQYKKMA